MTELQLFKKKVIETFNSQITDNVFCMIQNDRELLHEYLKLLEKHKINILNSSIAKEIKKRYNLENKDMDVGDPKSLLIQSFQKFNLK